MNGKALLSTLEARGITVRVVGSSLGLTPAAAVTPDGVAVVKAHKPTLLAILAGRPTPAGCGWCGAALAPYLIRLGDGTDALLCPDCHRWTTVGAPT